MSFARSFEIAGRRVDPRAALRRRRGGRANHNRDLSIAKELIDVAADAGADAVKFQVYSGKKLYSSKTPRFDYLWAASTTSTPRRS